MGGGRTRSRAREGSRVRSGHLDGVDLGVRRRDGGGDGGLDVLRGDGGPLGQVRLVPRGVAAEGPRRERVRVEGGRHGGGGATGGDGAGAAAGDGAESRGREGQSRRERRADGHLWVARGGVVGGGGSGGIARQPVDVSQRSASLDEVPSDDCAFCTSGPNLVPIAPSFGPLSLHPPQSPGARSMATLVRAWRVDHSRGRPFAAGRPSPTRAPGRNYRPPRLRRSRPPRKRKTPAIKTRTTRSSAASSATTAASRRWRTSSSSTSPPTSSPAPPAAGARRSSTPRTRRCRARDSTRRRRTPRSPTRAWSTPSKPSTARSPRRAAPSSERSSPPSRRWRRACAALVGAAVATEAVGGVASAGFDAVIHVVPPNFADAKDVDRWDSPQPRARVQERDGRRVGFRRERGDRANRWRRRRSVLGWKSLTPREIDPRPAWSHGVSLLARSDARAVTLSGKGRRNAPARALVAPWAWWRPLLGAGARGARPRRSPRGPPGRRSRGTVTRPRSWRGGRWTRAAGEHSPLRAPATFAIRFARRTTRRRRRWRRSWRSTCPWRTTRGTPSRGTRTVGQADTRWGGLGPLGGWGEGNEPCSANPDASAERTRQTPPRRGREKTFVWMWFTHHHIDPGLRSAQTHPSYDIDDSGGVSPPPPLGYGSCATFLAFCFFGGLFFSGVAAPLASPAGGTMPPRLPLLP